MNNVLQNIYFCELSEIVVSETTICVYVFDSRFSLALLLVCYFWKISYSSGMYSNKLKQYYSLQYFEVISYFTSCFFLLRAVFSSKQHIIQSFLIASTVLLVLYLLRTTPVVATTLLAQHQSAARRPWLISAPCCWWWGGSIIGGGAWRRLKQEKTTLCTILYSCGTREILLWLP